MFHCLPSTFRLNPKFVPSTHLSFSNCALHAFDTPFKRNFIIKKRMDSQAPSSISYKVQLNAQSGYESLSKILSPQAIHPHYNINTSSTPPPNHTSPPIHTYTHRTPHLLCALLHNLSHIYTAHTSTTHTYTNTTHQSFLMRTPHLSHLLSSVLSKLSILFSLTQRLRLNGNQHAVQILR